MNNLKKPIFWAYAIFMLYWLNMAIFMIVIGPYPIPWKLFFVVVAMLCLGALVLIARFPLPSAPIGRYFPLIMGMFFSCGGSLVTSSTLDILFSGGYHDPWLAFMGINGAVQLPVGLLMILFSVIGWIMDKKKTDRGNRPK